jgi:hypothetical protein
MTTTENTRNTPHLTSFEARTIKPLAAYALNGEGMTTVPGGATVTITENTGIEPGRVVVTLTVAIGGVCYARNLKSDGSQFTRL